MSPKKKDHSSTGCVFSSQSVSLARLAMLVTMPATSGRRKPHGTRPKARFHWPVKNSRKKAALKALMAERSWS